MSQLGARSRQRSPPPRLIGRLGQAHSDCPRLNVDVDRGLLLLFGIGARPLYGVFFVNEFARGAKLSFVGFLFRSQGPFLRPDLPIADVDARREGPPNRADPDRNTAISKTLPDFVQGQVRLSRHQFYRSRWRSEGSPLSGAVQSRRNLVFGRSKDPNHDADPMQARRTEVCYRLGFYLPTSA